MAPKKIRILYISQFFDPEVAAAAKRCFDYSKLWANMGLDVQVWTSYPNFPTGKLFSNYKVKLIQKDNKYKKIGLKVFRNFTIIRPNSSYFNRSVLYFSFCISLFYNLLINSNQVKKANVILGTSGTVFSAFTAYVIAQIFHKNFILEIRDITSLQIMATNGGRKTISYYIIKWLELYIARRANKVVTVTYGYKKWFSDHCIPKSKIKVIPNGIIVKKKQSEILRNNNKKEILISYFGTIGISQDIPFWIALIKKIRYQNDITFLFIGDGPKAKDISTLSQKISNLKYIPTQSREKIKEYYLQSDMCIVSLIPSNEFRYTVPSKLFDILSYSKPILFHGPENGEAKQIINDGQIGISLPNNIDIAAKLLINRLPPRDTLRKMGENGGVYVRRNFNKLNNAVYYKNLF